VPKGELAVHFAKKYTSRGYGCGIYGRVILFENKALTHLRDPEPPKLLIFSFRGSYHIAAKTAIFVELNFLVLKKT
jgi:hypothetical protein